MELKKSNKANLDKKRSLFMEIGLLIAFSVVLLAFELKFEPPKEEEEVQRKTDVIEQEEVQLTRQEEQQQKPPEPPKVADILEIVDDKVVIDQHIDINMDADLLTAIEPVEFVPTVQEEEEEIILFAIIEDKPTFNGKDADVGFRDWVFSQIKYPPVAAENGITGRVIYEFCIDKNGKLTDIKLLRGPDPLLDAEVLRVLKMSPDWTPGKQRGKAVKVRYQFPFSFQLQ